MNIKQLIEGWRNNLIPPKKLIGVINKVSKERLLICRSCEFDSINRNDSIRLDEHCSECLCTLSAKTKCLSCFCPLPIPKWEAILTLEEETKIKNHEKDIVT